MTAAVAGISRLRKTTIRSRNDNTTTAPMNSGSFDDSCAA